MTRDPNLSKIELIASALGPLRDRLVFVGGCAVGLLITDNAAAPARVTFDVDLVASVSALAAYHGIEKEFTRLGFSRDTTSAAPICRWRYRGLEVDLMPMAPHLRRPHDGLDRHCGNVRQYMKLRGPKSPVAFW